MMSQWFSFMTKASPFRLGEPFIQSHCLTSQVISSLLPARNVYKQNKLDLVLISQI